MKKRVLGLDIVKSIAIIFVIILHQMVLTGTIFDYKMNSGYSFFLISIRYIVSACVPLFLVATGYLHNNKQLEKGYYRGLIPLIVSYLLISVLTAWINVAVCGQEFNLGLIAMHIFDYTENDYSWYVEMFIGLYLLMPFINMAYHGMNTKHKKRILLFTLVFLTILPSVSSAFSREDFDVNVLPDYWKAIYPITYYILGAYISDVRLRSGKIFCIFMILLAAALTTWAEFTVYYGEIFYAKVINGFDSITSFVIAFFLFLLFYNIQAKSVIVCAVFKEIASVTFEMFLVSNALEKLMYEWFPDTLTDRMSIMIPLVLITSYLCAKLINRLVYFMTKPFTKKPLIKKAAVRTVPERTLPEKEALSVSRAETIAAQNVRHNKARAGETPPARRKTQSRRTIEEEFDF